MVSFVRDKDVLLMEAEARLDRLQVKLRKHGLKFLEREARRTLGCIRSVMGYHKFHRQQSLKSYGCLTKFEARLRHHAKYRGNMDIHHWAKDGIGN